MENLISTNNQRIAKNTLFLYFRSILLFFVGLYTSREVLAQLGVSDFGVYNVVGGVIVLFSFIQNAMASATNRFFTFDLGKGNIEQLNKTFSMSIIIHVLTALIILILGETIGLWFVNTQLNIPSERMEAANFVYQFSILSACVGILQVPYMAAINAHEKMKVYAYFGILDAVFKLIVALSLSFATFDKLKFYSILLFSVYIIMVIFYRIYCHRNFPETRFKWFWDKKQFLDRMKFSGFEFLAGLSEVLPTYGGIMLLNHFYGVLLNAAHGIAQQLVNVARTFTTNFFAAVTPQITKNLAANKINSFHELIIDSSKFCFLLFFMFMLPIILQADFILDVWLVTVPDYAKILCQLGLIDGLVCLGFWPVLQGIISTGKIQRFRIIDSFLIISAFPLMYFGLRFSPIGYICSRIFIHTFRVTYWTLTLHKLTGFPIQTFISQSLLKCLTIVLISIPLPLYITFKMNGWQGFLVCLAAFWVILAISVLFVALNKNERKSVLSFIKLKLTKNA